MTIIGKDYPNQNKLIQKGGKACFLPHQSITVLSNGFFISSKNKKICPEKSSTNTSRIKLISFVQMDLQILGSTLH